MRRVLVFASAFVAFTFITAWSTIINIPDDYTTIQAGINASVDGDTVLVQPGTYVENVVFNGHNTVLGSLFLTTGDASYISSTTIDGNSSGAVILLTDWEDNSAKIIGFTITNGISVFGGGIDAWFASPTILHNIIRDNIGTWYGGAISLEQCTAIVQYNVMVDNWAELGGGLRASYGDPLIGNNLIINNYAEEWGGGIYVNNNTPLIINNTISGNEAGEMGGALRTGNASPFVTNCIFYGNSAPDGPEISPWGNPVVSYSDISGGYAGVGNIDADPLFRDPDNLDFHLMSMECSDPSDSPCIDAGHPDIPDNRMGCSWGLGLVRSDMGAYGGEWPPAECNYVPGDCDHNGTPLEINDVIAMIGMYRGIFPPYYTCGCPPYGNNFAPEADPNGNCVAFELNDAVTVITAYWELGIVSGCEDCPGSNQIWAGDNQSWAVPSLKSKAIRTKSE